MEAFHTGENVLVGSGNEEWKGMVLTVLPVAFRSLIGQRAYVVVRTGGEGEDYSAVVDEENLRRLHRAHCGLVCKQDHNADVHLAKATGKFEGGEVNIAVLVDGEGDIFCVNSNWEIDNEPIFHPHTGEPILVVEIPQQGRTLTWLSGRWHQTERC